MFRRPPVTNPTSKPATTQAPTKTPTITRGNVASLVQLHDTRVRAQEAAAAPPPLRRTGTGRGRGRARTETIRDGSDKPPSSRIPSWKPKVQESIDESSPFQSHRRKSLAPRPPAIPRGHSPIGQPSRRASANQPQEGQEILREQLSRRSITGIHAEDQYAWQQDVARKDSWSRRASDQHRPSLTFTSRSEPHHESRQAPPLERSDSRRDSSVRRSLRPIKVQPMFDTIPSISDDDARDWCLDPAPERKGDWTTRRTSRDRSRSSYTDPRQGLFYGDLSPPQAPVAPQASPAADRSNPFVRRDSSGSFISTVSPLMKRGPISHKAFEHVRSMSPPSINEEAEMHTPAPQRPSEPSIATYITRKLSQHWTEPPTNTLGSPPAFRVPPSSPLPVHHIDSALVQDILSSIDSVLTEHTTALQTVITKSHQLLHEKERLCHSVSPRRSPKAVSPVDLSSSHSINSLHSSRSASPRVTVLEEPPRLLRRRTTSVPELLQLINKTASYMGLPVTVEKRDSLTLAHKLAAERRDSLPKSITQPDLTMPPNTRAPSPGAARPVLSQAALERMPTLSVLAPSTPSTASPVPPHNSSLQDLQLIPPGGSAISPGGQSLISPSEYVELESRASSPAMFTHSNMPTPSDAFSSYERRPVMMDPEQEYDRDAALVQRATRTSINPVPSSVPTTPYRQSPSWNQSTWPLEPFDPASTEKPISTVVSDMIKAVMEPEPTLSSESIESRVSRNRQRQVSDASQQERSEHIFIFSSFHFFRASFRASSVGNKDVQVP
ncbi:hypothetical protein E6O75_ATG05544 [Venturia nashicola]|uniref:Uncharacterized protein n=1 Tax=Venturia nashicola TaxID=86259 RepID=A0A4Z1PDN1_9PEZI|nr:hypothetical protein E6O75_ATG05544 [Venturia nashicola]